MGASLKGGSGGGRRARGRRHAPMAEINITPMVDVMLVLLIIFMVAAPLMTAGVPLDLPQAKGKPADAPKDKPIIVSITKDGKVFLGEEDKTAITLPELGRTLRALADKRGGTDEPIFVRGDKLTEHGMVTRVMAEIKNSGFRKLSIVTEVESGG